MWNIMMEKCFARMLVDSVGAKGESPSVSLPSVVSYTVTGTTCQKESAAQSVKVQSLILSAFNSAAFLVFF